jgi:hypothetical protein
MCTESFGELHRKFRSLAPVRVRMRVFCSGLRPEVSVRHRKFRLVQFVCACACEGIVPGSVQRFRYGLKVPVLAPEVPVDPS